VSASSPAPALSRFLGAGLHLSLLSQFRGPAQLIERFARYPYEIGRQAVDELLDTEDWLPAISLFVKQLDRVRTRAWARWCIIEQEETGFPQTNIDFKNYNPNAMCPPPRLGTPLDEVVRIVEQHADKESRKAVRDDDDDELSESRAEIERKLGVKRAKD
jgi:hypothetical protein